MQQFDNQIYHGECEYVGYSDSTKAGPIIRMGLLGDGDQLASFRDLYKNTKKNTRHLIHLTVAESDILQGQCPVYYFNDSQFMGYSDSNNKGPVIRLRLIEHEQLDKFRGLQSVDDGSNPNRLFVTICKGDTQDGFDQEQVEQDRKPKPKGPYGKFATKLRLSNFLIQPEVLPWIGTDSQYQVWTKLNKCVVCSRWNYDHVKGERKTEYAHVRRASNSGTAHKPEYSGVPMCQKHHAIQHSNAESGAVELYELISKQKAGVSAQEWFDNKSTDNLHKWAWEKLKSDLKFDSWSQISPATLEAWAHKQSERVLQIFNLLNLIN